MLRKFRQSILSFSSQIRLSQSGAVLKRYLIRSFSYSVDPNSQSLHLAFQRPEHKCLKIKIKNICTYLEESDTSLPNGSLLKGSLYSVFTMNTFVPAFKYAEVDPDHNLFANPPPLPFSSQNQGINVIDISLLMEIYRIKSYELFYNLYKLAKPNKSDTSENSGERKSVDTYDEPHCWYWPLILCDADITNLYITKKSYPLSMEDCKIYVEELFCGNKVDYFLGKHICNSFRIDRDLRSGGVEEKQLLNIKEFDEKNYPLSSYLAILSLIHKKRLLIYTKSFPSQDQ